MKTLSKDIRVLKAFSTLTFRSPQFSIEVKLYQPGVVLLSLQGFVQGHRMNELTDFITNLKQMLIGSQAAYVMIVDASASAGISLKSAQQILAKIRWDSSVHCLEVEYISAPGILNQVARMLFRLNPHKTRLRIHESFAGALNAAQNLLVSVKRTQTGELSEIPFGYRYEALTKHDYEDHEGNRHRFYLINEHIVLLQMERAVRTENMLEMLASQQYIGERLALPPESPKYMIVDVSRIYQHDHLSRKAMLNVREFFRAYHSHYHISYVITPPRMRGILKTLNHLAPVLRNRIVPVDSITEALDIIDKRQPHHHRETIPNSKKELRALVQQQQLRIQTLQQEQTRFSELLSSVFTRLVIEPNFEPEMYQPAEHASHAHQEAVDMLNYVQMDMQDILSRLQSQIIIREEAEEKARSSEQVKSQFLANMSHEMRTPMNAILGFSQLILKRYPGQLPDPVQLYMERIQENGQQLLTLINDVLDLARIEAEEVDIQHTLVDMGHFLPQILGQFESLRQGRILQLKTLDPAPCITTDEQKLRQILNNLLGNALKFTPVPGTITLALTQASDHYTLEVKDTGIGIPLDQQSLIFERFTQVEHPEQKRHRGTGLGLSISKSLAERMGYRLEVFSETGQGSVFSLIMPFLNVAKEAPEASASLPS
jgi:signal transduction histidine kinase